MAKISRPPDAPAAPERKQLKFPTALAVRMHALTAVIVATQGS
jgi:hypothetical protein